MLGTVSAIHFKHDLKEDSTRFELSTGEIIPETEYTGDTSGFSVKMSLWQVILEMGGVYDCIEGEYLVKEDKFKIRTYLGDKVEEATLAFDSEPGSADLYSTELMSFLSTPGLCGDMSDIEERLQNFNINNASIAEMMDLEADLRKMLKQMEKQAR